MATGAPSRTSAMPCHVRKTTENKLAAAKVGVRCGGDGVDSCVQVGVKTLGGLVFV